MRIRPPLVPLGSTASPLDGLGPTPSHVERAHARLTRAVGVATLFLGCAAAWVYHAAGLTLSHYDAKAHLVVARRVIDNLTPGWQQMGAIWLPLPHLLNLIPVQIDRFYRTGASAVAISVLAFALAALVLARMVLRATGSRAAAVAAAAVFALNPDVLYLQSTPMTESLLFALLVLAVALTWQWVEGEASRRSAGLTIAAACLTRYEAWPVTGALLALVLIALLLRGLPLARALRRLARIAVYPAIVVIAFLLQTRLTAGQWFITGGFFVPDNLDTGNPFRAVGSVWWGAHVVSGYAVELAATAGAIVCVATAVRRRDRAAWLLPLALLAAGALPAYAFFDGHPFRIRYMTPLVPGLAACAGLAIGLLDRWPRRLAAVALIALAVFEARPFGTQAPMVLEAQWDSGNAAARREVTRYLAAHYDGRTILASMTSLAHYMQELSSVGFDLKTFLHEGNGDLWRAALRDPRPHVGWILVEEWAEGGDRLAARAKEDPGFVRGFVRVAEGGGVALYRAGGADQRAGRAGRTGKGAGPGDPSIHQPWLPYLPHLP